MTQISIYEKQNVIDPVGQIDFKRNNTVIDDLQSDRSRIVNRIWKSHTMLGHVMLDECFVNDIANDIVIEFVFFGKINSVHFISNVQFTHYEFKIGFHTLNARIPSPRGYYFFELALHRRINDHDGRKCVCLSHKFAIEDALKCWRGCCRSCRKRSNL